MTLHRSFLLLFFTLTAQSVFAESVVTGWNSVFLQAVRDTRLNPPRTARAGAILHTCIFDAWACYDAKAQGTQYYEFLRRPEAERTLENKERAISFAAYRALADQFPTRLAAFDAHMATLGFDPADVSTDITTPTGLGNVVSTAVIVDRHYDGANQLGDLRTGAYSDYTNYVPVNTVDVINDPNRWQPLRFVTNGVTTIPGFLLPHWGNVRPFALRHAAQFRPSPPPLFDADPIQSAAYRAQAREIIRLTANLTDRNKAVIEYWADGPASETPPGHWNLLAQFVSSRDAMNIDRDAKLFFILNNAELDSSIACWEAKRFFDYARPITAIRFLKKDETIRTWGGTPDAPATVLGQNWKPFQPDSFLTPPFADYTSGHSCFSAAAAHILRRFTGSDEFGASVTVAAGSSKVQTGVPATDVTLTWATFKEAANQAGLSRRLGGIHYHRSDIASRVMGEKIAGVVWTKSLSFIRGRAHPESN